MNARNYIKIVWKERSAKSQKMQFFFFPNQEFAANISEAKLFFSQLNSGLGIRFAQGGAPVMSIYEHPYLADSNLMHSIKCIGLCEQCDANYGDKNAGLDNGN